MATYQKFLKHVTIPKKDVSCLCMFCLFQFKSQVWGSDKNKFFVGSISHTCRIVNLYSTHTTRFSQVNWNKILVFASCNRNLWSRKENISSVYCQAKAKIKTKTKPIWPCLALNLILTATHPTTRPTTHRESIFDFTFWLHILWFLL